jgi:hypothetical protein
VRAGSRLHHWLPAPPGCPPSVGNGSGPLLACVGTDPTEPGHPGASPI